MAGLGPGSLLGGYRIEALLGEGGMGTVYRARQLKAERTVALKVIAEELAGDTQFRERFRREARAAASLDHPHVVPVFDADEHEGLLYLAMPLVEGVDLATLLERERVLAPPVAVRLAAQIAAALDAAHAIGLVHRDVKPANVLVAQTDEGSHAYLTDFGVARRLQEKTRLTRTGMLVGTLGYLAPEALRGEGAGPAVDIYALGCLLYEALTGEVPFRRDNDVATIFAHLEAPPPPLASRVLGIPEALERAVHRALAKDPAERFASPNAFARAADAALATDDEPQPASASVAPGRRAATIALTSAGKPRPSPPAPTRKRVTLVYTVPSMDFGADPEVRLTARANFERLAGPILERNGGTLEASQTEGLIAVFGLPTLREDDAARAVRAALELRRESECAEGLSVPTTALATGVVLAGGGTPSATTLRGLLDQALHMRESAGPGDILVSDPTRGLAASSARFEPAEEGATEGAAMWRALPVESGLPAEPRRGPLVGRARELRSLHEALAHVAESHSSLLVSIVGEPGVGKSRLADEFTAAVGTTANVATARCLPRAEADARQPVRDLLAQLVTGECCRSPLELLAGEDAEAIAERVERLLGIREGPVPADELPWVVRRCLSAVAAESPLVVLFEDIHWAEPTLLELIENVAEWTSDAPLLLVCLARPELLDQRPDWGEGADAVRVLLAPLSDLDSWALLEGLEIAASVGEDVRFRIIEVADGNPLFVEQMVALVRDRPDRGVTDAVPPNIEALLAARLDQLGEWEREAASHASVIGREFSRGGLQQLLDGGGPGLAAVLRSLVRRELIERAADRDAFQFRHTLIRDAAYETLPKDVRARLHERYADWLESAEDGQASDEAIGYHLERSYRFREALGAVEDADRELAQRAAYHLGRGGRRAQREGDMPMTVNLLERALSLTPEDEPARVGLLLELGLAVFEVGDLARSDALLGETQELAASAGDEGVAVRAELERAAGHVWTSPAGADELRRVAGRALGVFERLGDERGLARAWQQLADVPHMTAHIDSTTEALGRALRHARQSQDRRQEEEILLFLAAGLYMTSIYGPTPVEEGLERAKALLGTAEVEYPDAPTRSRLIAEAAGRAVFEAMRGNFAGARVLCSRGKDALVELGQTFRLAIAGQVSGWVELLAGDPAAAEQELRPSIETLQKMGERSVFSTSSAMLAGALAAQGRLDEAFTLTELSEQAASKDDVASHILWRATRAVLLARKGDAAQAEALASAAVAVAEQSNAVTLHANALSDLSEVLAIANRHDEALAATRKALQLYEAKGNVASARRVRARFHRDVH